MLKNASRCFFVGAFVLLAALVETSAFVAPLPLYGPKKFERTKGAPVSIDEKITLCAGKSGTYRLIIENGDAGGASRISSGTIKINRTDVVKQNEFSQQVGRIEKTVTLNTDNTLSVSLASGPAAFINVSLQCLSNCLDVRITEPTTGSISNNPKALIKGNIINKTGDAGIVLSTLIPAAIGGAASQPGQVYGSSFAGKAYLADGSSAITAIVTDSCGYKATDTITVTRGAGAYVEASALPNSGVYTSGGVFVTAMNTDVHVNKAIASYAWDTNGDNIIDVIGRDYSSVAASFRQSGLYFPRVIVTDAAGNQYSDTIIVSVMSASEADALFKARWEGMKSSLAAGDIDGAIVFFEDSVKEKYRQQFVALSASLPVIAADMSRINFDKMHDDTAVYEILSNRNGATYSFSLVFVKDTFGLWKIRAF